ncbi:MAG: hypothetical protein ABSC30_11455 [Acidimicrobiales bacterium]|jgi:hypothetical protein
MTTPKLTIATLLAGFAVTLTACGVGNASHVVARLTPTTSKTAASTTTVPVPGTGAGSTPVSTPGAGTPAPSDALSPQTLDQVAADLGTLDTNLNTANSDLNHPQGDS